MRKPLIIFLFSVLAIHAREPATNLADIKRSIDKLEVKIQQLDSKIQTQTTVPAPQSITPSPQSTDHGIVHILVLSLLGTIIVLLIAILLILLRQRKNKEVTSLENRDVKSEGKTRRKVKADQI